MVRSDGDGTLPSPERNVVLIILDSVRKDYFDIYAPRIQRLSDVSFSQCRAASTWSVPSHASIFTGKLPHEHGIHADSFDKGVTFEDMKGETFLSTLSWRKVGLSGNAYLNSTFGFDTLFDQYQDFVAHESLFPSGLSPYEFSEEYEASGYSQKIAFLRESLHHQYPGRSLGNALWKAIGVDTSGTPIPRFIDDGARAITTSAIESASGEEPFCLFINYMDAHTPLENTVHIDDSVHSVPNTWTSSELHNWEINKDEKGSDGYFKKYRALYGASIEYLDRQVSSLINEIEDRNEMETTYIVTSDHGNNLGYPSEDGLVHHTGSMSEGISHVPLEIINPPEGFPSRVDELVSQLSLSELIERVGTNQSWDGKTSREAVAVEHVGLSGTGDPRNYRDFAEGEFAYWNRLIRCVYRDCEKFVWDSLGNQSTYHLDPDRPCWQRQVQQSFRVGELEERHFETEAREYKKRVSTEFQGESISDESVEKRLRRLGYM